MREILFRGKRTDNKEWIEGCYVRSVAANCPFGYITPSYPTEPTKIYTVTLGQYTGLTDKNGKKIFEGDICQNTKTKEVVSVGWHGTMAGYVWSKPRKDARLYDFGELFRAYDRYEVIGNIHDNPELLKGEQE